MTCRRGLLLLAAILSIGATQGWADDGGGQSIGSAIGGTARQIVDGTRQAVKETKEAFVKTGQAATRESRKAAREITEAGRQGVRDAKESFSKDDSARSVNGSKR